MQFKQEAKQELINSFAAVGITIVEQEAESFLTSALSLFDSGTKRDGPATDRSLPIGVYLAVEVLRPTIDALWGAQPVPTTTATTPPATTA